MKRNWYKYHNTNSYGESDCQLITCLNIYYHLTGIIVPKNTKEFLRLAKLGGCWSAGSCTACDKVYETLGIEEDKRFYANEVNHKQNQILEASIWHPKYGFHSVAVVDYCKKADALRVTNFKMETTVQGWIFRERFNCWLRENPDKSEPRHHFRSFKLAPKANNK